MNKYPIAPAMHTETVLVKGQQRVGELHERWHYIKEMERERECSRIFNLYYDSAVPKPMFFVRFEPNLSVKSKNVSLYLCSTIKEKEHMA